MHNKSNYLIGESAKQINTIPYLVVKIKGNQILPRRKVFQVLHRHEDVEFLLVTKHKLKIQTPISTTIINEGQGVFIPKNRLHVLDTYGNCECVGFIFDDQLLVPTTYTEIYEEVKSYTDNPMVDLIKIGVNDQEAIIIDKLENLRRVSNHQPQKNYEVLSSLYDLWNSFTDQIAVSDNEISKLQRDKGDRLLKYLSFIHENYSEAITVEDIASSGFTSVSECNRTFKQLLETTAYDYLIKYRINKSLDYLKEKEHSIATIAHMVGYGSPSQFTRFFKRHMNMRPKEYRQVWR